MHNVFEATLATLTILALFITSEPSHSQITVDDFSADFESGNIATIQDLGGNQFSFKVRLDDLNGDSYGWFYFAVSGGFGQTITMHLTNPDFWQDSLHVPLFSDDKLTWERVDSCWQDMDWLSFRHTLTADTIWFAQSFPYTTTAMYAYLDSLQSKLCTQIEILGYSINSRPIKMITITDFDHPDTYKKHAWLISRQHPMESSPSFLLRGMLEWATGDSFDAQMLRRDVVLHVVPIANPDGVSEGYSRHNVNGINLNRDWQTSIDLEQPEVQAIHARIQSTVDSGRSPDIFMDLHASQGHYDFGYRLSAELTNQQFYASQGTFLTWLENYDQWQQATQWLDLDTNYAQGVSCVVLYDMYQLDCFSSENPWCRRKDSSFITIAGLIDQGPQLGRAIYDYLCPFSLENAGEEPIAALGMDEQLNIRLKDHDQADQNELTVTVCCAATGDSELVTLGLDDPIGYFVSTEPLPILPSASQPGDGAITCWPDDTIRVTYEDPDLPSRIYYSEVSVIPACGDIIGDGKGPDVLDLTYLIDYLFRNGSAPHTIEKANVDGQGGVNVADLTYLVDYLFRGGAEPDCQPIE